MSWRVAEPWDVKPGVAVKVVIPGGGVVRGRVRKALKNGWAASVVLSGGKVVTRDVRDIAVEVKRGRQG